MYVSDLLKMYPMNVEGDRLVCGPRFPLQLGVALVIILFEIEVLILEHFLNMNN